MNVAECEAAVARLGKFENESRYVPFFWEEFLNGGGEEAGDGVVAFPVFPADVSMFPELKERLTVKLRETDQGFVVEVE